MSAARVLGLALCIAGAAACRQLPSVQSGVCGNAVIDPGESCDGFARGEASCRPPGSVLQCHLDCSLRIDGTRPACPRGWGCSNDQVCRQASGNYRAQLTPVAGNAFSLLAADFDGDGRGDIVTEEPSSTLGATKVRVHYFDREANLIETWRAPLSLISLAIAQLSSDGHADLVVTDGRVAILHGQSDRSLISQTYPSYALPGVKVRVVGPLLHDPVDDASALVVLSEQDGTLTLSRPDVNAAGLLTLAQFPGTIDQMAGMPAIGNVFEDDLRYPCQDVAMALRGAQRATLYSLCERDPQTQALRWRDAEATTVTLEPAATIDRGPLLVDMNGDGHLDLLLGIAEAGAASSGEDSLYVALGDGASLGSAQPLEAEVDGAAGTPLAMPLEAGDFNGDGAADLIYARGFLLSRFDSAHHTISYHTTSARLGSTWSEARIADLNGNGMPDVIAASRDKLDIDFFNGTNTDHMNPFVIATTRPVEHLAIGDFDGDLIDDVAFSEAGPAAEPRDVAIAFGNQAGHPAAPTVVARVAGVLQLGALPYADTATVDGLSITYLQIDAAGVEGSALAQLAPIGDRSMMCGIELTSFATDGSLQSIPGLALTTGAFTGADQQDAILLGANLGTGSFGMWLVPDIRNRTGRPQTLGWSFDSRLTPLTGIEPRLDARKLGIASPIENPPAVTLLLGAGDLDKDGVDELVVAAPDQSAEHCLVATADVIGGDKNTLAAREPVVLDDVCTASSQFAVRDVDGDGVPDVVLLTGSGGGPRKLLVLWNDGSGGFSTDQVSSVVAGDQAPQAFALFRGTKAAPVSLAYVTQSRVHVLKVGSRARDFADQELDLTLVRGTGITATDVDGDGVTDLVVADDGSVRVLRAELQP